MKILVLGCGSIGSRHARNLRSLGIKKLILVDQNIDKAVSLGAELKTKLIYDDYVIALNQNPDLNAAIICTPSSLHIKPAIFFANHKISLFIEKPLSNNLQNTSTLIKLRDRNKIIIMMGHSYIFEKGFVILKSLIDKKTIGDVYFATYLQGQYLPDWHPWADYKTEYSARKNLGGGALLTLTSHSFYVLEWLFGKISNVHGSFISRIGSLKVNVDDSVFLLMETKNGVVIQSQNNFISKIHQHRLIVEGSKGSLEYDFVKQKLKIMKSPKNLKIISTKADNNERFLSEMKYFLKSLTTKKVQSNLDLESGVRFLEIIKQT